METTSARPLAVITGGSRGLGFESAKVLAQRGLWGTSLGHFAGNYNWYFILSFMPLYLVDVREFSMEGMAWVLSSAYVVNAVCAMASMMSTPGITGFPGKWP